MKKSLHIDFIKQPILSKIMCEATSHLKGVRKSNLEDDFKGYTVHTI